MAWKFDSFLYSKLRNNQNYDEEDRFIKENKDYWYEKGGRKRMVSASKVLRFDLTEYVTKTGNYDLSEIQTQALSNIVTTQIVREVVKKFVKNCNPEEFFANGGDDRHLAIVLARECQQLLGPSKKLKSITQKKIKFNFCRSDSGCCELGFLLCPAVFK